MKIGILTLPFNNNYGGYLQAYALMTVLKGMGHEVELIYRKHNKRPLSLRIKHFVKAFIKCCIGRKHERLILDQEKELREKGINIMPFVDAYITPKTKQLFSTRSLRKICRKRYDTIIVGSDQVWRSEYVPRVQNFFLDFVVNKHVNRVSYAASFGERYPKYTEEEKLECGNLIKSFDCVSLREDSGIDVIKDFGWKTKHIPVIVLDPTMLLDMSHYEHLISCKQPLDDYVCTYLLDENTFTHSMTEIIVTELRIPKKSIIDEKKWKQSNYRMPSIDDWLKRIHDAKFVITDSFHGTVFSIIFNVPFVVYNNKGRGSDRFITLLRHFGLENRLVTDDSDIISLIHTSIPWEKINYALKKMQKKSLDFLKSSLLVN